MLVKFYVHLETVVVQPFSDIILEKDILEDINRRVQWKLKHNMVLNFYIKCEIGYI